MNKLKDFWKKHESKIILIVGFILVASISFEAGLIKGREIRQNPMIIEKPTISDANQPNVLPTSLREALQAGPEAQNLTPEPPKDSDSINTQPQNCAFVGSKNSNKYHLPTCRYAKNIKPENLICFKDENEAKSKGYLPDKNCIK